PCPRDRFVCFGTLCNKKASRNWEASESSYSLWRHRPILVSLRNSTSPRNRELNKYEYYDEAIGHVIPPADIRQRTEHTSPRNQCQTDLRTIVPRFECRLRLVHHDHGAFHARVQATDVRKGAGIVECKRDHRARIHDVRVAEVT